MRKLFLASLMATGLMLAQTPTAKNPVNDATQGTVKHHKKVKVKKTKDTVETDIPASTAKSNKANK